MMKLVKKHNNPDTSATQQTVLNPRMDRRTFLRRSGVTLGSVAAVSSLSGGMVRRVQASAEEATATPAESGGADKLQKDSARTPSLR